MIDGVSNQMKQRVFQAFDDGTIELDVAPFEIETNFPVAARGEIPNQPLESFTRHCKWHHAGPAHLAIEGNSGLFDHAPILDQIGDETFEVTFDPRQDIPVLSGRRLKQAALGHAVL